MRDPNEKMVYCLEAIVKELHETNKQLKMANQIAVMNSIPNILAMDTIKERTKEITKALDLA